LIWLRGSSGRGFSGQSEYRGSGGHVIRLRGVSGQCTCFEGEGETERFARKVANFSTAD